MLKPDQIQNKAAKPPLPEGAKPIIIRCSKCQDKIGERWRGKVFNVVACRCEKGGN